MKKYSKSLIVAVFVMAIIVLPHYVLAGRALLNWNANTESDLAGYKVYYGTSPRTSNVPPGGYTNGPIDVGNVISYNTNPLNQNQKYYFSVAAVDTSGNVSNFSSEVNKTILGGDIINDSNKIVNIFDYNEFVKDFSSTDCNSPGNIVGLGPICAVDIFDYNVFVQDFGKAVQ